MKLTYKVSEITQVVLTEIALVAKLPRNKLINWANALRGHVACKTHRSKIRTDEDNLGNG